MADPAFGAARRTLEQTRVEHAARRAAAGLESDMTLPAGAVIQMTSTGRTRTMPALTDADQVQAVLMARAVVALDDRAAHLAADVAERDRLLADMLEREGRTSEKLRELRDRLAAVEHTHPEAEEITWMCGNPCQCADARGLGVCETCGEPYPCNVVRAARGLPPYIPAEPGDETPEQAP